MSYPPGRTEYHKLIRDHVPDLMRAHGVTFAVAPITDDAAFRLALLAKLREEVEEVASAKTLDDVVSEIADVLDVLAALQEHDGITDEVVHAVRAQQNKKKGGFTERLLLAWSEQPSSEG